MSDNYEGNDEGYARYLEKLANEEVDPNAGVEKEASIEDMVREILPLPCPDEEYKGDCLYYDIVRCEQEDDDLLAATCPVIKQQVKALTTLINDLKGEARQEGLAEGLDLGRRLSDEEWGEWIESHMHKIINWDGSSYSRMTRITPEILEAHLASRADICPFCNGDGIVNNHLDNTQDCPVCHNKRPYRKG